MSTTPSPWSVKRRLQHLAVCGFIYALPVCLVLSFAWTVSTVIAFLVVVLELSGVKLVAIGQSLLASTTAATGTTWLQAMLLDALAAALDVVMLRDWFVNQLTARSARTWVVWLGLVHVFVGLVYLVWVVLVDARHTRSSRRRWTVLRWPAFSGYWSLFRGYFDAQLFIDVAPPQCPDDVFVRVDGREELSEGRLAELEAAFRVNGRYLMCCHPHGLFGFAVWCTFVCPIRAMRRLFDRRDFVTTIHTLAVNFRLPLWREGLLALRFSDASKGTITDALGGQRAFCLSRGKTEQSSVDVQRFLGRLGGNASQLNLFDAKGPGHIAVLVPGGAAESVRCTEPVLMLKQRKGFVRVALETGASLVPVLSFGETDLYAPLTRSPAVLRLLVKMEKVLGVGTPLVIGRNVFNPFAPRRGQLKTVIGRPLNLDRFRRRGSSGVLLFDEDDVNAAHEAYLNAVTDLFNKFQPVLDPSGPSTLLFE